MGLRIHLSENSRAPDSKLLVSWGMYVEPESMGTFSQEWQTGYFFLWWTIVWLLTDAILHVHHHVTLLCMCGLVARSLIYLLGFVVDLCRSDVSTFTDKKLLFSYLILYFVCLFPVVSVFRPWCISVWSCKIYSSNKSSLTYGIEFIQGKVGICCQSCSPDRFLLLMVLYEVQVLVQEST